MPRRISTTIQFILAGVLLMLAVAGCGSQEQPATPLPEPTSRESSIYGRWSGVDKNNEVIMMFEGTGNLSFAYLGSLHGGTFKLNTETTPMQLDLMFDDNGTVLTILEFVDADTIRIENNAPGAARVTTFSDFFTVKRIEE